MFHHRTYITPVLISVRTVRSMQPPGVGTRIRPRLAVAPASWPLPPHAARPSCTPSSDLDSGSRSGLMESDKNVSC